MSSRYGGQGRKNVHAYRKGSFKAGVYGYALDAVVYQDANGKWRYGHNDKLAPTDLVTRIHRYENKPPDGKIPEPYTVIDKYGKAHTYGVISPDAAHAGSLISPDKPTGKMPSQADLVKDSQNPTRHQVQEIPIEGTKKKLTKILRTPEEQAEFDRRAEERAKRPGKPKSPEQVAKKLQQDARNRQDTIIDERQSKLPKYFGEAGEKPTKRERRAEQDSMRQEINKAQHEASASRSRQIEKEFLAHKEAKSIPKALTLPEYLSIHYGTPLPKNYEVTPAYIQETTRTTRLEIIKTAHQRHEATRLKDESLYRDQVFKNAGVKKRHQPKLGETLGDERSKARRDLTGEVLRQETYAKHATWDAEHQPNPREYKKIVVTRDNITGHTHTSSHKESDQYRFGHAAHNRAINSIRARIDKIEDPDTRAVLMDKLNLFEHQLPFKATYHDLLTDIKRIRSYEKRSKKKK